MKTKRSTSLRLTEEAKELLEAVAEELGVTLSAVLELAIREKAKRDLPQKVCSTIRTKEHTHASVQG